MSWILLKYLISTPCTSSTTKWLWCSSIATSTSWSTPAPATIIRSTGSSKSRKTWSISAKSSTAGPAKEKAWLWPLRITPWETGTDCDCCAFDLDWSSKYILTLNNLSHLTILLVLPFYIFKHEIIRKIIEHSHYTDQSEQQQRIRLLLHLRSRRYPRYLWKGCRWSVVQQIDRSFDMIEREASYATAVKKIEKKRKMLSLVNCFAWF